MYANGHPKRRSAGPKTRTPHRAFILPANPAQPHTNSLPSLSNILPLLGERAGVRGGPVCACIVPPSDGNSPPRQNHPQTHPSSEFTQPHQPLTHSEHVSPGE